jgi:hypothetical protein
MKIQFVFAALLAVPSVATQALAEAPQQTDDSAGPTLPRGYVVVPPADLEAHHGGEISNKIFLNRCVGGCTITPGSNDARENTSTIVSQTSVFTEFAYGDEVWQEVLDCVREVYAPFDVEITDQDPGELFHHEAIVAGTAAEAGLPPQTGGVAPLAGDCRAINNVISFSFANQTNGNVAEICWTVAQETAHAFGLDHEYACSDPMTYIPGCGVKYFRDVSFDCGENGARICQCGGNKQNSHRKLLNVFGAGAGANEPSVEIQLPEDGSTVEHGSGIFFSAEDVRGLRRAELIINGYKWLEKSEEIRDSDPSFTFPGAWNGERFDLPAGLPDGVQNIELRVYNDIEVMSSANITVTIGSPCTGPESCLDGQSCNDGACSWPAPTGELGDECERDQDCISDLCPANGAEKRCSEFCTPTVTGACGDGYECLEAGGPNTGVCWPAGGEGGGCCSVGRDQRAPWLELLLFAGAIALVVRRRRR